MAKSLLREELLPAKWVLDFDMRFNYLVPMLEWCIECDHDWSFKTGVLGKGLKKHLPTDTWAEVVDTFTGPEPQSNWEALFKMVDLFGRTAEEVAHALGYSYPADLVTNVAEHARRMRQGLLRRRPTTGQLILPRHRTDTGRDRQRSLRSARYTRDEVMARYGARQANLQVGRCARRPH